MMLWFGVANAALFITRILALQVSRGLKLIVLVVLAGLLSLQLALVVTPLALAGVSWQFFEGERKRWRAPPLDVELQRSDVSS